MGGLVAMEMAVARPRRVWALGLLATTAQPVTDAERRYRLALAGEVDAKGMEPVVEAMGPVLLGPHADVETRARVHKMMMGNNPVGTAAALRGRDWEAFGERGAGLHSSHRSWPDAGH